ncbi:hypothetical protein ZWY2020_018981 [Hordeum vulgare]|nr:hypothetical protein ZWY2020_018981 [Hordeum vulgare]
MDRFSKEQEDALQLLSSLHVLEFWNFKDFQQLPAGLRSLTTLKILSVNFCPAVSSLPNDALPDSLEKLYVGYNCSEELKQYCRGSSTILIILKFHYGTKISLLRSKRLSWRKVCQIHLKRMLVAVKLMQPLPIASPKASCQLSSCCCIVLLQHCARKG